MNKISKIKSIRNMAIFKDFEWDNVVKDKNGNIQTFKDINIIYGRNYSGKTTLSRIFRAFETGILSDKYVNSEFQLSFEGNTKLTQNEIDQKQDFRVFNSDFIDENLSFIHNENGMIEPFAILGEDNQKISQEIKSIQEELGIDSEDEKTGLYRDLAEKNKNWNEANNIYTNKKQELDEKLTDKARRMKNDNRNFVPATYNIGTIRNDIKEVQKTNYIQKTEKELEVLQELLKEDEKTEICKIKISLNFQDLNTRTKKLVEKKFETASKIQELVENSLLNNWVEEGLKLHNERKTCAFCGNEISNARMHNLKIHFDNEKEKFDNEVDILKKEIQTEENNATNFCVKLTESSFYSNFQIQARNVIEDIKDELKKYNKELENLSVQLDKKKNDVFHFIIFQNSNDLTQPINNYISTYNTLVDDSNEFGKNLKTEKENAKQVLRLNCVSKYIQDINYTNSLEYIENLESAADTKKKEFDEIKDKIDEKKNELRKKELQLNDEQKGAEKVNEYLSNFFGYGFLKLVAQKETAETEDTKQYIFEIQRNGEKAYNLSEGECRLVAFAYFMAKLNDVDTKGKKTLIWIDDPICSLDANHVFFVYSLISSEIVLNDVFGQLFITTHNLDFLKYLKRLKGKFLQSESSKEKQKEYFILERNSESTKLKLMPDYMKEYITEFNYLFKAIYDCANAELNEDTYPYFYNFSNNARKFLEIYIFYKYPDNSEERKKQESFFQGKLPVFLNERITNEYSHSVGTLERASMLVEYPVAEMKKDAQLILCCIEEHDKEQYKALLNSIGVPVDNSESATV